MFKQVPYREEKCFDSSENIGYDDKVHVLFLIDQLCESGGAERWLLNIASALPRMRFRASIATFKIDRSVELFRTISCPVHVLPLTNTCSWHSAAVAWRLRELIREQNVSIVHTCFETSDIWGGLVARLSGCPCLISSRRDMGILRSRKHRAAYRLMTPLFDRIVTVSEEVRRFCLREDRVSPEKVVTVHNGIDLEKVDAIRNTRDVRERLDLKPSSPVVISVAHIREVKGTHTLIEAAGIVCRKFPDASFVMVGEVSDQRYYQEISKLVEKLELTKNVTFIGASEDVIPLLKASDVFCLLSRSEGFSNAILEAMTCSLPVVTTRVGGNPEAIQDNVNGFLVEPGDSKAAAARITRLLRDRHERERLGRAARLTIENKFTNARALECLTYVYEDLISDRQKGGRAVRSRERAAFQ